MARQQGQSRDRVPILAGRCDPVVERAIRDLYLRFYKFTGPTTTVIQPVQATPDVPKPKVSSLAYTIVFTIDGLVGDDQITPYFTDLLLRDGYAPYVASVTAVFPPGGDGLKVNFLLEDHPMLTDDLVLPAGQNGPATVQAFHLSGAVPVNQKFQFHIVEGGGAGQVTGQIVMRKVTKK